MTSKAHEGLRLLGSLGTEGGRGVVRIEERYDTDIDDLWTAITDPRRLARWLGVFEGDLRLGGEYRARYFASGWEGVGRVEVCGDQTVLVIEGRGMPADKVAGYGAGTQIHVEDLTAYVAGGERCDSDARMGLLFPAYQQLPITHR